MWRRTPPRQATRPIPPSTALPVAPSTLPPRRPGLVPGPKHQLPRNPTAATPPPCGVWATRRLSSGVRGKHPRRRTAIRPASPQTCPKRPKNSQHRPKPLSRIAGCGRVRVCGQAPPRPATRSIPPSPALPVAPSPSLPVAPGSSRGLSTDRPAIRQPQPPFAPEGCGARSGGSVTSACSCYLEFRTSAGPLMVPMTVSGNSPLIAASTVYNDRSAKLPVFGGTFDKIATTRNFRRTSLNNHDFDVNAEISDQTLDRLSLKRDVDKRSNMDFAEPLPESCPPSWAQDCSLTGRYRAVVANPPTEACFASHSALGIRRHSNVSPCDHASCSLMATPEALRCLQNIRRKNNFIVKLEISEGCG
ncbi:hypothetical protein FHS79_003356 [Polymorphobacter multimanifer]|uniref:Uncharacterized protein n=1 Tax=Polymorphobacter multimanifer TaxID=1070431 RepID=A0A841LH78_9SPHN|nr:hypothetical protein [Polymorphobacter multimanifer]